MTAPTGTQTTDPKTSTDATTDKAGSDKVDAKVDGTGQGTDADKKSADDAAGLKSALQKERKRADEAERKIREAELEKLPELERFKSEAERLGKENEKLTLENQKMRIGLELGLKWSVAKRITGDSEAEMRSDAADLLKELRTDTDDDKSKSTKDKDKDAANRAKTNDGKASGSAGAAGMNELFRRAAGRTAR